MVRRGGWRATVVAVVAGVLGLSLVSPSASAVTTADWATWDPLTGAAGNWTTTVRLPAAGFPAATVTSDSRGGQVGVQSGASTWLSDATPPGAVFGSSRDQQYLNLRPRVDNATSPSTTRYVFERPTPAGGWAFVLGDIDADRAVVSARGADGQPLTAAELGWQGGFNYCAVSPRPSCTGDASDVPTWDPATGELRGNAAAADTSGAAGWFRPTVPVTSLTVEFFQRSGFPVYQTWFASLARDIAGTVSLVDADGADAGTVGGATLTLRGPDGTRLATTTSAADGTYAFPGYTAAPGYTVELTTLPGASDTFPTGLIAVGPRSVADVDLTDTDATGVDFAAREIRPTAVSGTVRTPDGQVVPGATVTLTPVGGGAPFTAVSGPDGAYIIDDVPWDVDAGAAQEYAFTVTPPDGYTTVAVPANVVVEPGDEAPLTGNDAVVRADGVTATVSGTVTGDGDPVVGVVVTLRDADGGPVATASTRADGTYAFGDVPAGDYTVTVEPPAGYVLDGAGTRDVTITGGDVTGVDFTLVRLSALGGTVTDDDGAPVPGATVTVTGPDGPVTVTTDDDGAWSLGSIPAGDYTVTLTVPDGFTADRTERRVTLAPGQELLDQDFTLTRANATPVGGTVSDPDGAPVPDVTIDLTDGTGEVVTSATTDADGTWAAAVPPGTWTATVTAPEGWTVVGDPTRTVEVGTEPVTGVDFVLEPAGTSPEPTPTPTPTPSPAAPSPAQPGAGGGPAAPATLPLTGVAGSAALAATLLVMLGGAALLVARRRTAADNEGR